MSAADAPASPERLPVSVGSLFTLAWPIIVSRSTQTVIGVSDAVLVADLGSAAVAATSAGAFNTFALLMFPMGVMFIVSSFASQLYGQRDLAGARRYGFYGLVIALATQVLCMGVAATVVPLLLGELSYEPDVRQLMTVYLQVRLMCGGAAMGIEALANYYGGVGNTRLPMFASLLAMVLNVVLNIALIKGLGPIPAMGVTGSALASTLATWVAFLWLFWVFWREDPKLPRIEWKELKRMLRFGMPSGFNWFFEFLAFNIFINVVVAGLGTVALAGLMSVFQINSVSFMPAFGLASAGAILVGQSIGANDKDAVPRIVRLTLRWTLLWQGAVGVSYLLIPRLLMKPFAQGEAHDAAALVDVGARMLMLSAAWQLFDATCNTVAEALRAAGDTAFTLKARLVLAWGVFFPGSWVTVRMLGGTDVHAVLWVVGYLALLAAVLWLRFRSGKWRELELVEPKLTSEGAAQTDHSAAA
ncbi:MAG: MATE family efflux transporter [Archangiaceae bacterium]|nr:MATE family efflux transporter [Archangiaceae bacterium]